MVLFTNLLDLTGLLLDVLWLKLRMVMIFSVMSISQYLLMEEVTGNYSLADSSTTNNLKYMIFSLSQVQLKDLELLTFMDQCSEMTTQTPNFLVELEAQWALLSLLITNRLDVSWKI
jgi:hypothetical protein